MCFLQGVWLTEPDHSQAVGGGQQLPEAHRRRVQGHQGPLQHGRQRCASPGPGESLCSGGNKAFTLLLLLVLFSGGYILFSKTDLNKMSSIPIIRIRLIFAMYDFRYRGCFVVYWCRNALSLKGKTGCKKYTWCFAVIVCF